MLLSPFVPPSPSPTVSTGLLYWVTFKSRNLFVMVLETKSKIKGPAWLVTGENSLPKCKWPSSDPTYTSWKEGKRTLWTVFQWGTNPIHEDSTFKGPAS